MKQGGTRSDNQIPRPGPSLWHDDRKSLKAGAKSPVESEAGECPCTPDPPQVNRLRLPANNPVGFLGCSSFGKEKAQDRVETSGAELDGRKSHVIMCGIRGKLGAYIRKPEQFHPGKTTPRKKVHIRFLQGVLSRGDRQGKKKFLIWYEKYCYIMVHR